LLIAQKYQGEVVYQEEVNPQGRINSGVGEAMIFISTLAHPLMI